MTWVPPEAVITRSIVISERVSVPVLSEQMTEAEPSVSTDDSFLTIALRFAIRCTPIASTTDRIAGSPSGTAATASDTPSSRTRDDIGGAADVGDQQDGPHHHDGDDDDRDAQHAPDACRLPSAAASAPPRWPRASRRSTPISVSMPVAVTTARPVPCATAVPLKTMSSRSPSAAGSGSVAASLSTASLSPVSEASCTRSDAACDQARIRADGVAFAEHEQVAAHQLGAGHAQHLPVAHDGRGHRGHAGQRGHGVLRLGFLHIAEDALRTTISAMTIASTGQPAAPSITQATSAMATAASSR